MFQQAFSSPEGLDLLTVLRFSQDHLMVFLQNVVHLCHVLAADGLDDVAFVVRGMESGTAASLRLTVQRSAAGQWILQTDEKTLKAQRLMKISYRKELKEAWPARQRFDQYGKDSVSTKLKVFITVDVRVTGSERTFLQTVDMFMFLTDI